MAPRIFVVVAAILVLSGCAGLDSVNAPPTVKIGLIAPFEGLYRPLGYEALFGVKLAVQERNQAGGPGGYQIQLVALNDFNDPDEAELQARALTADPAVLGVVGHFSSEATLAALPIYQEARLAVSIPWSVARSDSAQRAGVVSIAATKAEANSRLETIAQQMGFNHLQEIEHKHFEQISSDTQALQLATDAVSGGEIILGLQEQNVALPLFGQVDVGSGQLPQVAKTAANGLVFVSPGPDPHDLAGAEAFIEAYQALAGFAPGPRAVLAYDATQVLLDAIEDVIMTTNHHPTRSEVSAVINGIQRNGLSGEIVFDAAGQRLDAPVWVYEISNGQYPGTLITPQG